MWGFHIWKSPKRKLVKHAVFCLPLGYDTPVSRHAVRFSVVSFELLLWLVRIGFVRKLLVTEIVALTTKLNHPSQRCIWMCGWVGR
jgi:hypothetical protein